MRKTTRGFTLRSIVVVASFGLLFAAGVFHAASQHFRAIDYSMKNSRLKKQIDELQAEKRRLLLAKEIAMSPGEIDRTAKRLGLVRPPSQNPEPVRTSAKNTAEAAPKRLSPAENASEGNPFVVKTTSTKPSLKEGDEKQDGKDRIRSRK
jgi:hypothetical protein